MFCRTWPYMCFHQVAEIGASGEVGKRRDVIRAGQTRVCHRRLVQPGRASPSLSPYLHILAFVCYSHSFPLSLSDQLVHHVARELRLRRPPNGEPVLPGGSESADVHFQTLQQFPVEHILLLQAFPSFTSWLCPAIPHAHHRCYPCGQAKSGRGLEALRDHCSTFARPVAAGGTL